ncbi:MAG: LPS assembly protein LptD [Planctomycetaceae bacterium]|nr:LPS assembly protein LptD [Planctomycetaceae bacterium]
MQLPDGNPAEPIIVRARAGSKWEVGSYEVWLLRGECVIQQGQRVARSREAVLWLDRAEPTSQNPNKVIAYLEGSVEIVSDVRPGAPRLTDQKWFGRLETAGRVDVRATEVSGRPQVLPAIYWRAMEWRSPETGRGGWRPTGAGANANANGRVVPAQYAAPLPGPATGPERLPAPAPVAPASPPTTAPGLPTPGAPQPAAPVGVRRVRVFPRSNVPVNGEFRSDPNTNQQVAWIDSGVNVIVDISGGLPAVGDVGTIDVSADRVVVWTSGLQGFDVGRPAYQDQRTPLEIYLEGNIIFRQGERTIYADRMYYDVLNHVGTVLNADVLTPARNYQGLLRLHADVLQQTGADRYFAHDAFLTSSRMGQPSYRLQATDIYFEDLQIPVVNPATGQPAIDPATGQPAIQHQRLATADNDFLFIGSVPVFYWPRLATDLNEPSYYIRRATAKQDSVFGTQILTKWDGYQLLGIKNKPAGTNFDITLDYLSKRGFGHGGSFTYDRADCFGLAGHTAGLADYWGIQDSGVDNLGKGRSAVPPEQSYRYRLFWQHREMLPYDLQLTAELGWISDRNFLEEYYKSEWETLKDENTGVELKQITENRDWSLSADYRLNDFFTDTNWLPRADHFWIGQSLFGDVFTWNEHSSVGYAQFRQTTVPDNVTVGNVIGPAGSFNYLPWEQYDTQGARLSTRQELDWPIQLGLVKVVPFALGDATYYGADQAGDPLTRLFWEAGIRASIPMYSVDPTACSELFNVHGLAHKVNFEAELSYAQSNKNLEELPLYDPLDDNSVEAWRRIFMTNTFGVPSMITVPPGTPPGKILIPPQFDERLYALRSGLQDWVTSPSTEIAGDMAALRFGVDQRWQTKRGPADNRHIIDWMSLDTNVTFYPDPDRDNFGKPLGLLDYNYAWHVGDRLTLTSDGIFDFFDQGQKIVTVGAFLNRPPRGSLYMGFRLLEGPIDSKIVSLSYSYWMSPKWVSSFGTTVDLGHQGNIGENFTITRIGESLLISAGFNVDAARNSVGVALAIEPRFLPKTRLGNVNGAQIPPAGAFGLE